jgi:Histidine kinase-, DNA gyrase B-, and HSP90-like ATPase
MRTTSQLDFLSDPTAARLRKEIQNICDSYSHPWDLLAELCQNSVDAIRLHQKRFGDASKTHQIQIRLNALDRSLSIRDSGIGFDPEKFQELLAPHGTDKVPTDPVIGQKGVGLTYTLFIANSYGIETRSVSGYIKGAIRSGAAWRSGSESNVPMFDVEKRELKKCDPSETFAEVTVQDVERFYDEAEDLFSQSFAVVDFLLRTKTAIGYLKPSFGEGGPLNISVQLDVTNRDGKTTSNKIEPTYMLPEEFVAKNRVIELDEFKKLAVTYDDQQKARKFTG